MLNLLCGDIETIIEEILSAFGGFIFVAIGIVGIIIKSIKKGSNSSADTDSDSNTPFGSHPNATGQLTPEQTRYLQNNKRKMAQRNNTTPATTTTHDDGHVHLGTTETYEPIVGSLGAVSDEGCDELNGVRLIATDLMYETEEDGRVYDMDALRKSLILGEILNKPRFKYPHGKK